MTTEFSCTLHSANNIYPWPRGKSSSRPDKLHCSVLPIDEPLFYRWLVVTQRVDPIRGALKYCNCLSFPFIFATTSSIARLLTNQCILLECLEYFSFNTERDSQSLLPHYCFP